MAAWQGLLFSWTPEKAWFLGVLWGDGNVHRNPAHGTYRVSVCGSHSTVMNWIRLLAPHKTPQEFKRSPGTF